MGNVIGYIRVSTQKQDVEKQRYLLYEYARKENMQIKEFVSVEASTRKSDKDRKLDELFSKLKSGDTLLVAELSRLQRSMIECINLVNKISEIGVDIRFIRQPELNTSGTHKNLMIAIFGHFAESERELLRLRTIQGLEAAREKGRVGGRPKGVRNKKGRVLDPYREQIKHFLSIPLPITSIEKLINNTREKPISYNTFYAYINEMQASTL